MPRQRRRAHTHSNEIVDRTEIIMHISSYVDWVTASLKASRMLHARRVNHQYVLAAYSSMPGVLPASATTAGTVHQ